MDIKIKCSFFSALITASLSSNLAHAEPINYENAIQLIVCASVYQTAEYMLLIPATGKTSNAALSNSLHNKQKILITKAVHVSNHDFVRDTRKRVIDRLLERSIDEYAASKNNEIEFSQFLLNKYDKSCMKFIE